MNKASTTNTTSAAPTAAHRAKAGQRAAKQTSKLPQQSTAQKPIAQPRSPQSPSKQQPLALGATTFSPGQPLLPRQG